MIGDDIRKTLSDPKPLYALAGVGDLAAEKLKDAPERLRDAPALLTEAGATITTLANKLAAEAPERLAKVSGVVQDAAGGGRPDPKVLRELAQTVAIQQVGRLLEAAGKAVETYDELAERGKVVVERYAGGSQTVPGETVNVDETVTVLVEQMTDEELAESASFGEATESAEEAAAVFVEELAKEQRSAKAKAQDAPTAEQPADKPAKPAASAKPKPAAKKTAPARKRASSAPKGASGSAAPKTPRPPKA